MNILFAVNKGDNEFNRRFLAQGVMNAKCVNAGKGDEFEKNFMSAEQLEALKVIRGRLFSDEELGTIELYDNGCFNVFLKQGGLVTGMFLYRGRMILA